MVVEKDHDLFFVSLKDEDDSIVLDRGFVPPIPKIKVDLEKRRSKSSADLLPGSPDVNELIQLPRGKEYALKLSSSLQEADLNRRIKIEERSRDLAERDRRIRERREEAKKRRNKETREYWTRMREREFVVNFRRERLLNVPRSKLLEQEIVSSAHLSEATLLIQNLWMHKRLGMHIKEFLGAGIIKVSCEGDLEAMKKQMMDKLVIEKSTELLKRIIKCNPLAEAMFRLHKSGKILLTSLLLDNFGEEVMPNPSPTELVLLEHAGMVSESLQKFLLRPNRTFILQFTEAWITFNEYFGTWQQQSIPLLVKEMQSDYLTLEEIVMKLGPESKAEWMPHVRRHQERLKKALKRVAGKPAMDDLDEKVRSLNLNRPTEKDDDKDSVPNFDAVPIISDEEESKIIEALGSKLKPLDNVKIAHELVVDPKFDYEKLMKIKAREAPKANFEGVVEGTNEDLLKFIFMVRSQLLEILHNKGPIAQELLEHIQEDFITEQLANKSLDIYPVFTVICECISKMCSPARDQLVNELSRLINTKASIEIITLKISQILTMMHEDMINFGFTMVKPHLAKVIVTYERNWFAENVLRNEGKITKCKDFVKGLIERLSDTLSEKKPISRLNYIIAEVFLKLIENPGIDFELIRLDFERIRRLGLIFDKISTLSALFLAMGASGHPNFTDLVGRIKILADDTELVDKVGIKAEVLKDAPSEKREYFSNLVSRILEKRDPINSLMQRRIIELLRQTLLDNSMVFSNKPESILSRNGISVVLAKDFNEASEELVLAYRLHRDVLIPIYNSFQT